MATPTKDMEEKILEILKEIYFEEIIGEIMQLFEVYHNAKLKEILKLDESWSLISIMEILIEATDILLHEKDYDRHGWEEMEQCYNKGKEIIEILKQNSYGNTN